MAARDKILIIFLSVGLAIIYKSINEHFGSVSRPDLPIDQYWGEGEIPADYNNSAKLQLVRPYYQDSVIDDLIERLGKNISLTEPLEDVNFEYGFNSNYLKEVIQYWRENYLQRWREREIKIWQFAHYTTFIQGLRMHYLHLMVYEDVKETKQMYPLLILHGWPSSVREFYNLAPKLYEGNADSNYVFDIVIPSLPGFGWSQGSAKKGMGPAQAAIILRNLMVRIGYEKFFIHGSDWGSIIGSHIATLFPENVLGFHSSMCVLSTPLSWIKHVVASLAPSLFVESENREFFFPLSKTLASLIEESGYFHLQATKPDTIGAALTDNPIGLAAYILEKFSTWTNSTFKTLPDGGLTKRYKLDTLIDNVMIYYLTNSITTSQRLYAEAMSKEQLALNLDRVPTSVPTACARFKGDSPYHFTMDFQLKDKYKNLIQSTYHQKGGHFAALERPNLVYKDFIDFVKKAQKYIKK